MLRKYLLTLALAGGLAACSGGGYGGSSTTSGTVTGPGPNPTPPGTVLATAALAFTPNTIHINAVPSYRILVPLPPSSVAHPL